MARGKFQVGDQVQVIQNPGRTTDQRYLDSTGKISEIHFMPTMPCVWWYSVCLWPEEMIVRFTEEQLRLSTEDGPEQLEGFDCHAGFAPGLTLDDLLPMNDSMYSPPANLAELFERGSPLFESADLYKFSQEKLSEVKYTLAFRLGYEAAMFNVFLKSGKPFTMQAHPMNEHRFVLRGAEFRRSVGRTRSRADSMMFVVSGHVE